MACLPMNSSTHWNSGTVSPDTELAAVGLPSADELLLLTEFQDQLPPELFTDKFGRPDFEPKYWPPFPDGWWYDPEKAARIELGK